VKILILTLYYEPDLSAGSFRCTALVNKLLQKKVSGLNVEVITSLPNRYATYSVDALQYEKHDNIEIHRVALPTHKSGMLDQIKAFYFFYKKACEITRDKKYDLVFATSSRLFTAFLGARISKSKKIPLYLDIRDIFLDTLKDVLPRKISFMLLPFLILIEKYTFSNVAKVNLVSGGFFNYFKCRYPMLTYEFYTNGIDEVFIEAIRNRKFKNTINSNIKTILYAGNIGEGQGLHRIIPQMAEKLSGSFRFQIIGDGGRKDQLVKSLKKIAPGNVELIPPVSRKELIEYYCRADILFLHLNDYDAFVKVLPSKIFEYAVFNKPMLAGVSGYAAKFIQANITNSVVFKPCNAVEAIQAISRLCYSDEPREHFVDKYSRDHIMEEMSQSLLSLIKN
jgi:glycosyltransferase involved in cell wall biosynthesis